MIHRLLIICVLLIFASCNSDDERRNAENARDLKKKELIFSSISKAWNFNAQPINPVSKQMEANWPEWRVFLNELSQKPQSTIGAFRKKSKALSQKVAELNKKIPSQFDKPEIKSRIAVLTTKINSLNLFINLDNIPEKKVTSLISEINLELSSLQHQMEEIVRKTQIPKEEGEADMIRMLDTSRAVPSNPKPVKF